MRWAAGRLAAKPLLRSKVTAMPSKNRDTKHMTMAPRSVFNEQAALASLFKVISLEDVKRDESVSADNAVMSMGQSHVQ